MWAMWEHGMHVAWIPMKASFAMKAKNSDIQKKSGSH